MSDEPDSGDEISRASFGAAVKALTSRDPLTILVLKGHLLIEEQIEKVLAVSLRKPEKLDGARLTFAQKVALLEAIADVEDESDPFLFEAVRILNKLRNEISHQLDESEGLGDLIRQFSTIVSRHPAVAGYLAVDDVPERFFRSLISLIGWLTSRARWLEYHRALRR